MECNICYDTISLNKSSNTIIPCLHCDIKVCRNCVQKYILSVLDFPKCMKCKTYFDFEYLHSNMQKKFINNEFKTFLENLLYNREQTFFKKTYSIILKNKQRNNLKDIVKISNILIKIFKKQNNKHKQKLQETIKIKTLKQLNNLQHNNSFNFKMHCTNNQCSGIINSNWNCDTCQSTICNHCYKIKNINHVCDKNDLLTVYLLKNDTHSCPSCSSLITKIDGCDQMYCTHCNTPFSWKTGMVLYGNVHNPHYFEWARKIGMSNQECEQINPDLIPFKINETHFKNVNQYIIDKRIDLLILYGYPKFPIRRIFKTLIRFTNSLLNDEIVHWNQLCTNDTEKLRIDLLTNNISINTFKKILRLRYNKTEKYKIIFDTLVVFATTIEDYVRILWASSCVEKIINLIDDINHLRHYFNNEFKKISINYNIFCPYISNTYRIYLQNNENIKGTFTKNDLEPSHDLNVHTIRNNPQQGQCDPVIYNNENPENVNALPLGQRSREIITNIMLQNQVS